MRQALILCAMALSSSSLLACEQKSDAPSSGAPARSTAAAATSAAAAAAGTEAADDLPTEQDFEEEVAKEVTADNLESELDKMEKEIGQ